MKVCFLAESLERSGGVSVIEQHVLGLREAGVDAEIVLTRPGAPAGRDLPVRSLEEARGERFDVAVATWWLTAAGLYELEAERRVVFLQSLEHRFYTEEEMFERLAADAVLGLPVDYVAIASWMRALLAEVRPDARCLVVPNGIDKGVFAPRDRRPGGGRLRVLVEGQPSLWFKGVREAVEAVRAMSESAELTLAALDPAAAGDLDVDRVVGGLSPAEMADLYAETDVVLKLSRVEGLGLVPLEAFHMGVPCVVTPYTGHEDYVRHGENGIVVGFDDQPGTVAWLDALARDRELLARLSEGALATAREWPSRERSSELMAAALRELAAAAPPRAEPALARLLAAIDFAREAGRTRLGALHYAEAALEDARAHVRELSASRDECAEMLDDARRRLDEVMESRAYRAAIVLRGALDKVRR